MEKMVSICYRTDDGRVVTTEVPAANIRLTPRTERPPMISRVSYGDEGTITTLHVAGASCEEATMYELRCCFCGSTFLIETYGDGRCSCGVEYHYDEGHAPVITERIANCVKACRHLSDEELSEAVAVMPPH